MDNASAGAKVLLMHKVLVLGGEGMLGQMVYRLLSRTGHLTVRRTCLGHKSGPFYFNVEDGLNKLYQIVERYGPFDYLINCIGILSSEIEECNPESLRRAILVNSLFPQDLAMLAQENGVRVIHISTDGVFARNAGVCLEDSLCDCEDTYGKTKSLGEVVANWFLNLRCSIIGPSPLEKKGLLEWFRSQQLGAEVHGYTDHMWNGVTTLQFAKLCNGLISQELFDKVRSEAPVHHFCPNQAVSKYELLQFFRITFRPDVTVKPATSQAMPVSRILDTRYHSLKDLFGYGRPMQYAIEELASEM